MLIERGENENITMISDYRLIFVTVSAILWGDPRVGPVTHVGGKNMIRVAILLGAVVVCAVLGVVVAFATGFIQLSDFGTIEPKFQPGQYVLVHPTEDTGLVIQHHCFIRRCDYEVRTRIGTEWVHGGVGLEMIPNPK